MSNLHEECGVFAIISPEKSHVAASTYYGLFALQHRGQESCGIVVNDDGVFTSYRDNGIVNDVFTTPVMESLGYGNMALGHVRYGTSDTKGRVNAQPIVVNHVKGHTALAYNGAITNYLELRRELELGMKRLTGGVLILIRSEYDDMFAGIKGDVREDERDLIRSVRKAVSLERDGMVAGVGQLDPVRERTDVVGICRSVGGHDLRNAQVPVSVGDVDLVKHRAGDIGSRRKRETRSKNDQHDHQRDHTQQGCKRSLARLYPAKRLALSFVLAGFFDPFGLHE